MKANDLKILLAFLNILIISTLSVSPPKKPILAEEIRKCRNWQFFPSDDPRFGNLVVNLKNKATIEKNMTAFIRCSTMKIIDKPESTTATVKAKSSQEMVFVMAVESKYIHYDSTIRSHRCTLTTYTQGPSSLKVTCSISISVWPRGMFSHTCKPFKTTQIETTIDSTKTTTVEIVVTNTGPQSIFLANASCSPTLPALQHNDMFRRLKTGATWTMEFPKSCTGTTHTNYRGQCKVAVSHLCRKKTTFVKSIQFLFVDGEIEECEFMKASYVSKKLHVLAKIFGTNDLASAALIVVIVTELVLITLTLALGFKKWRKPKDNFVNAASMKEGTANVQNFGWSPSVYKDVKNVWKEDLDSNKTGLESQPKSGMDPLMDKILKSSEWTVKRELDTPRSSDY